MTNEEAELIQKLAMSLDAAMDLIKVAALNEKLNGSCSKLRKVTWQNREKNFADLIGEARDALSAEGRPIYF